MGQTIIDKLWAEHTVADLGDGATLLYIDRVFLHERTGSVALKGLEAAGHTVRHPEQVFCTMDHIVDTLPGRTDDTRMPGGREFITSTRASALAAGIHLFDLGDDRQGIVHVVSPEQGIALPGVTLVCPDSHTCTLGGLGALAWGIGSTEGEHALATKTLAVRKPRNMRVRFDGELAAGRLCQGPDPAPDRPLRCLRRHRLRDRVRRRGDTRTAHRGTLHPVQHGRRVRRLDRHRGAG